VTLTLNAHPKSYVGLLGVDQSVLLLKRGNDIESATIFRDLNEYGQFIGPRDHYFLLNGSFYHADYKKIGAVVLTNAQQSYSGA
jgi:CD109 antigen